MERIPTTREGYEKIREEIRHLEEVEMPKIAQKIADARAEGDLSENAEYHGQREAQGLMQARINRLKEKLANSYIVDKSAIPKGIVAFGCVVRVKNIADGIEEKVPVRRARAKRTIPATSSRSSRAARWPRR